MLERSLPVLALEPRPVQQAMRVEGVVDAAALVHVEGEAERRAARADAFAVLRGLLRRDAVFLRQVLDRVLAFGRHLRIELEGLEMQLDGDVVADPRHRLLQRMQPDRAPGARDIGHEIDLDGGRHDGTYRGEQALEIGPGPR